METKEVKRQRKGNGFDSHPENINRAGGPDKLHWWNQLFADELELESKKRIGYSKKISVVRATVERAEEGDMSAVKEIGDRLAGKSKESVNMNLSGAVSLRSILEEADEKD